MDTRSRREDSKAVRDEILGPQGDEMRCSMEWLVTVKCRYSFCETDDFVFSMEFGRRSACEEPFDLIRGPLGAQNAFGCAIYSIFLDAQEGRKGGFRTPRECRGPTDPPGILRFKMKVLCVLGFGWGAKVA